MGKLIKLMLVDDHVVVRSGLKSLLSRYQHFNIVAEASSGSEAILLIEKATDIDIILMDIRMPNESGIVACKVITDKYPHIKVIMLTSYDEQEIIYQSIVSGASGYLLKEINTKQLIESIEKVSRGEMLFDSRTTLNVLNMLKKAETKKENEELSLQEKRVLAYLVKGMTNRQIGEALHLSEKTIRNYVSTIFSKIGVNNRAEAAAYAVRNQLDKE